MLKLVLGPMKSGKSFALINKFAPLAFSDKTFMLFQPKINVREDEIKSRNGVKLPAKKIAKIADILSVKPVPEIIGIDEIHLFDGDDIAAIEQLLKQGHEIFAVGLNVDYRGKMFDIVKSLLELVPDEVIYLKAVCEICQSTEAIYSQIWFKSKVVTEGLPSVVPEDGTYVYKPVCRKCFRSN